MARSTVLRKEDTRKAEPTESTATRSSRRRSSSRLAAAQKQEEDLTASDTSVQKDHADVQDQPLRKKRKSSSENDDATRQHRSDDQQTKKRAATSTTSKPAFSQTRSSTKNANSNLTVNTSAATVDSSHQLSATAGSLTLLTNQVTPSPAAASAAAATGMVNVETPSSSLQRRFEFSTPRRSSSPIDESRVVDLYPNEAATHPAACHCAENHCSSLSLTSSFLSSYGRDYWTGLKARETPSILAPPGSSNSNNNDRPLSTAGSAPSSHGNNHLQSPATTSSSRSSSSSDNSNHSQQTTPEGKWEYYHNSSTNSGGPLVKVPQPIESTLFLHYQPELTPKMRAILVDWIIELSEHFSFSNETLHLAVTLIDKVLACGPLSMLDVEGDDLFDEEEEGFDDGDDLYDCSAASKTNCFLISRDKFQLLGAACTWLACKYVERNPPKVGAIAYVSDNIYTVEQIKRMERRICTALGFSFHFSTPYMFLLEFLRASNECPLPNCSAASCGRHSPAFVHYVNYLLELGRLSYFFVTEKPSLLTAAALYLAQVTLGIQSKDTSLEKEGRWSPTLQHYTGYTLEELREPVLAIHRYQMASEDSSLSSTFVKYMERKYHRVALKTVPRVEDLGFDF